VEAPAKQKLSLYVAGSAEPLIWRQILLPRELNFAQLHEVIQAAFGWTDAALVTSGVNFP